MWPVGSMFACAWVRRYPYLIVYVVRDPQVVIIAIAHQRRRPGYWLSRMQR
jgi:plasmid stabilization system protein ParE